MQEFTSRRYAEFARRVERRNQDLEFERGKLQEYMSIKGFDGGKCFSLKSRVLFNPTPLINDSNPPHL